MPRATALTWRLRRQMPPMKKSRQHVLHWQRRHHFTVSAAITDQIEFLVWVRSLGEKQQESEGSAVVCLQNLALPPLLSRGRRPYASTLLDPLAASGTQLYQERSLGEWSCSLPENGRRLNPSA